MNVNLLHVYKKIHSIVNNIMDWTRSGSVMRYSRYMESQDGTMFLLPSSCRYTVAYMQFAQKEGQCCEGQLSAHGRNQESHSLSNGKKQVPPKIKKSS